MLNDSSTIACLRGACAFFVLAHGKIILETLNYTIHKAIELESSPGLADVVLCPGDPTPRLDV